MRKLIAIGLLLIGAATAARAELRLPAVFGDHMVLQREKPVPVWGWADAGAAVTVTIAGQTQEATADENGYWRVELAPLKAGGPVELTCVSGGERVALSDVLVGEVWLCSGQSNMDFALVKADDGDNIVAAADDAQLRLFKVERTIAKDPADDLAHGETWAVCTPASARSFSAVAYFFGSALRKELGVPVGLIQSSYGGTGAESWTSGPAMAGDAELNQIIERYQRRVEAHAQGKGAAPAERYEPGVLFNGMIQPLAPFALRGVTWYQGESNSWRGYEYRKLLPALINDWRQRWGDDALPFGVVQLPNYSEPPRYPRADSSFEEVREAQLMTAKSLPGVGLVVTIDVGDPLNIHPTDKRPVGDRLAKWALGTVYGESIVYSGPMLRAATVEGDHVVLTFDHTGSGLDTRDGGPVRGLAIAGADGKFRWADSVKVEGDRIIVSDSKIAEPAAVRYAWRDDPSWANLTNREGLPASPFRTDDWPGVTAASAEGE